MKRGKIKNVSFWISVLIVGIIFSATFLLILLDLFKEQKATSSILIIAKSEQASSQIESITNNIAEFPKMLSFYERLIRSNSQIKDNFSGKSQDEKKELWNRKIDVSIGDSEKGTIIYVSAYSKSSADAEAILKIINANLFQITSDYYDTNNDIDISIIDGPIVSTVSRKFIAITFLSFITGMLLSLLLNLALNTFEKIIEPKKIRRAIFPKIKFDKDIVISEIGKENEYKYDIPYDFEKLSDEKDDDVENLEVDNEYAFTDNSYPNYPEMPRIESKKASAPDNLPIFNSYEELEVVEDKKNVKQETEFVEIKKEEPTAEELRDRLNKLLRGDM